MIVEKVSNVINESSYTARKIYVLEIPSSSGKSHLTFLVSVPVHPFSMSGGRIEPQNSHSHAVIY